MKKIIKNLVKLGNRQGKQADKACEYLRCLFQDKNIPFKVENYKVEMPQWGKSVLKVGGKTIPGLPTGLTSGVICSSHALTSSLISSKYFIETPHINFNPECEIISRANFSFAPSFAVSKKVFLRLCGARKVEGRVSVKRKLEKMQQILVGNMKNPKNIVFTHFDSIGKGAVDNASGTAVTVELVTSNQELLQNTLFVFDGNEEISYDNPVYWGKGYRNFEKKYPKQMKEAQQLIVVDCVGYEKTEILSGTSGAKIIKLAFPIENVEKYSSKIKLVTSDYDKLMTVYHSDKDDGKNIQDGFLEEAFRILNRILS